MSSDEQMSSVDLLDDGALLKCLCAAGLWFVPGGVEVVGGASVCRRWCAVLSGAGEGAGGVAWRWRALVELGGGCARSTFRLAALAWARDPTCESKGAVVRFALGCGCGCGRGLAEDDQWWTVLVVAVRHGHVEQARLILGEQRVLLPWMVGQLLSVAACALQTEMVRWLLGVRGAVDLAQFPGVLSAALLRVSARLERTERQEITRLLLEGGARADGMNSRALYLAAGAGELALVRLLLDPARPRAARAGGNRAIVAAAAGGHAAVVEALLQLGGYGPHDAQLGEALRNASQGGHDACIRLVLRHSGMQQLCA
jgi:hypothetical protein